jgi:hypothetical protein
MDDLEYQALDEIQIDAADQAVDVQYSEGDQGGTLLRLRFRLPRDAARLPAFRSGYAYGRELTDPRDVAWRELPSRVGRDVLPWLAAQRVAARAAGKVILDAFLGDVERNVRGAPAQTT